MSFVEVERNDGIMVVRLNRPDRMNSLGTEMRNLMADAWCEFRDSKDLEVAIFTGTGRAFCAGEDMKESVKTTVNNTEVELIYDPVLNCYFDYKTNIYYEMKS